MKVMKGKMRKVLALLLIVAMVVTTIQISPVHAQAATQANLQTTYDGEGYTVTFKVTSQWSGTFNADVTIKNTSDKVIDNWALGFAMPYEITKIWNGVVKSNENGTYEIKNAESNQDIAVGNSVNFGFSAKADGELVLPSTYELLCFEEVVAEGTYEISFKVTSDWKSAFNGEIRIKNISEVIIEDWKLEFDFEHKIDRFWTAEILKQEGNHYYIKNAGYNANIKPGETVVLGFDGNPGNVVTTPINYKLTQVSTKPAIEYIELEDGKIEKSYLERAIYPKLLMDGKKIDHVKLSDDFDGDSLTLAQEYNYDTNPFLKDSDEDGLDDSIEISLYATNPNYWDTDHDEMSDGTEVACGLNPLVKDSDGNGILDNQETISQSVRLDSYCKYNLIEVKTLPSVTLTGKGDFSRELSAISIDHDRTILDINSLVGTPFEFEHDDELTFDSGTLTFNISDDVLANNKLQELAIAYYNRELNSLEILDTTYNSENHSITANVTHFSPYMVVNVPKYLYDIDWKNESSTLASGKADVVFVIDTTGSMGGAIQNVRNNVSKFVSDLKENHVDVRLGLVEYRDIYVDGNESTKSYDWYTNVNAFQSKMASLGIGGGGDLPESAVDALHCAENMSFRSGVDKYIILVTDANSKSGIAGNSAFTMELEIENLVAKKIVTSVVTTSTYKVTYSNLVKSTDGINGDIYNNFAAELKPLINKMVTKSKDSCWVRLSDGSCVSLDKDPALGDETVDSDEDGIPDIIELKTRCIKRIYDIVTHEEVIIYEWSYYSNPDKKDTDGDGLEDIDDLNPSDYDTVVVENSEYRIRFNSGRVWNNIDCNSFDLIENVFFYEGNLLEIVIPENIMSYDHYLKNYNNIVANLNKRQYSIDELSVIGLVNNEGSKIYMDGESSITREKVFKRLANRGSDYYKHSGIWWWENWDKVSKETEGGYFKGTVLSEADINFTTKMYFVSDIFNVLNYVAIAGAIVIAVIVIIKLSPVILANLQGIIFYIKTFGVKEGFKMYQYLGVSNLPNSVITWVQWDVADGDSSIDDILVLGKESANTTKIYRVVNDAEFQLIKDKGQFEELPQYMSSKWFFANDIEYAKKWSQAYYPDGKYKIIQIYAPNELLKGVYYTEKIDLIGPAYCFELDEINNVLNNIKN